MRVRNIPGIEDEIARIAGEQLIAAPEEWKGRWQEVFRRKAPLHVEIGCGKGKFIAEMARNNPQWDFVAIEKVEEVVYKAVQKGLGLSNLRFLLTDGRKLTEYFGKGEVSAIYLNFSDPWPKERHHKRRLTSQWFLPQYIEVLAEGGKVCLKTDNPILFQYSLNTMEEGFILRNVSSDYRQGPEILDVATEYEEKFRKKGNPIYRLEAYPRKEEELKG